jgi:hypothetical protein
VYTPAVIELAQWFLVSLMGSVQAKSSLGHQKPLRFALTLVAIAARRAIINNHKGSSE